MTVCISRSDTRTDQSARPDPHLSGIKVMAEFQQLAARQSAIPFPLLAEQQARLSGPAGQFAKLSRQVKEQGRQAPVFEDSAGIRGRKRQALCEDVVQFVLGVHHRRPPADNPFQGLPREHLCCVVFDDTAPYSLIQRYAAHDALRQHDSEYFAQLIATTRDTVERRIVFHGLLEHFDRLLPIEKSIYPLDYRAVQQTHLDHEEALYGKLTLEQPVSVLLKTRTPQWLLDNLSVFQSCAG